MARKLKPSPGISKFRLLYDALLPVIAELRKGELVPSEYELCSRYGVSRSTVRRTLSMLEEKKIIVRRRGSGTYVR
jgi:GntR family transcriptional regulator